MVIRLSTSLTALRPHYRRRRRQIIVINHQQSRI